ncbi:MAG: acyl-CoA carboxylase subunit epsilon [Nocardiopsaceae bacterium]|nr:acyl-CoA carboxylase subunit epsilon [Nocardiopsaceae bacterium]
MSHASEQPHAPFLRLVRGNPGPEETAALVAVLTARARAIQAAREAEAAERAPASGWRDRGRLVRRPLAPGPGAWRGSFRPG